MGLSVGIVDLPNVGPSRTLPIPVAYVRASWSRVYGAFPHFSTNGSLLKKGSLKCH